jgi:DNA-binding transcriptional ArsR family regulator
MDLETLARGLQGYGHPIRIGALVLLEYEHSPSELFELLDGPSLGTVAYHVRMLRDYGLVSETRTEPRRGALEHFYRRTELADALMVVLAPVLGVPPKRRNGRSDTREADLLELVRWQ